MNGLREKSYKIQREGKDEAVMRAGEERTAGDDETETNIVGMMDGF